MQVICFVLSCLFCMVMGTVSYGSCGSASCAVDPYALYATKTAWLRLDYETIDQSTIYVGDKGARIGAIAGHHDEMKTLNNRWVLSTQIPIQNAISLYADIPIVQREHSHTHNHHGTPLLEQWNFTGIGDMSIGLLYAFIPYRSETSEELSVSSILKLPTGITNLINADGDEAEVAIQPGSGSYDTSWGIRYSRSLDNIYCFSSAIYTCTGRGTSGWRFGNRLNMNTGIRTSLLNNIIGGIQLNALWMEKAEAGTTGEDINNTGGTWLFISPSLETGFGNGLTGQLLLQLPVYRNVNGIQITSDCYVRCSLSAQIP